MVKVIWELYSAETWINGGFVVCYGLNEAKDRVLYLDCKYDKGNKEWLCEKFRRRGEGGGHYLTDVWHICVIYFRTLYCMLDKQQNEY